MRTTLFGRRQAPPLLIDLDDLPECDAGTPEPTLCATEQTVKLAYFASTRWCRAHALRDREALVVVTFHSVAAISFGAPNDELLTCGGHALARFGLAPYRFCRVEGSPWIADLRRMSLLHPSSTGDAYARDVHLVLPFHDSTIECVAGGYSFEVLDGASTTPKDAVRG